MRGHTRLALSAGSLSLLLAGCAGDAKVLSPDLQAPIVELAEVSTTDRAGDAVASQGNGLTGETYQDIVRAAVDADQGTFTFSITVASSVPPAPPLSGGNKVLEWDWNLNTGPELPRGYPFATGSAAPPELIVMVLWDGVGFRGVLVDRRPLLTNGEAVTTPISFGIDGATITAQVSSSLLGDPSGFGWVARTNNWPHLGSSSIQTLDRAPDAAPAFWP